MTEQRTNRKLQSGDNNNPEKIKRGSQEINDQDGNIIKCIKCGSANLYFYDGWLGYESVMCRDCGHDQQDCVDPVRVEFLYRDAHNYKTFLERSVEKQDVAKLQIGQVIEMGEYRTPKQSLFFDSPEHPYPYNPEYDHNLLKVTAINSIGFVSQEYCPECDCVFDTENIIAECPQCKSRVMACNACRNCGCKCGICVNASMFNI